MNIIYLIKKLELGLVYNLCISVSLPNNGSIVTDTKYVFAVESLWAHVLFSWDNRHAIKIYVARMSNIKSV